MSGSKNFFKPLTLVMMAAIVISFSKKQFAFDGGTINNPNMVVVANSTPPEITATNASGCSGTITYQWQQSTDGKSFSNIPNSTGASYLPTMLFTTTQFRRKAVCSSGDTAYTNNVATIIIQ